MTYEFLTDPRRACRDTDPETFYPPPHEPERRRVVETARAICQGCPFTAECLQYAADLDDRFGVFGGLTANERARGQGKKLRAPAPSKAAVAVRRAKVMRLTDAGTGCAEIAEVLGISRDIVVADRRRAGQALKSDRWVEVWRRIDELDAAGYGATRIARELSIDRSVVYGRRARRAANEPNSAQTERQAA
jgi:DNA-binding CsgD family transcriptional regulator